MNKIKLNKIILLLVFYLMVISQIDCYRNFIQKELKSVNSIRVIHERTPDIEIIVKENLLKRIAMGGCIGVIGGGLGYGASFLIAEALNMDEYEKIQFIEYCGEVIGTIVSYILYYEVFRSFERISSDSIDLGNLLTHKFCKISQSELIDWPELTIDSQLTLSNERTCSFEFQISYIHLTNKGIKTSVRLNLIDHEGTLLWSEKIDYAPKKNTKTRSLVEFKQDNFQLLKEEMNITADSIAKLFIQKVKKIDIR